MSLNERVPHPKCSGRKFVRDGWIDGLIVRRRIACRLRCQTVSIHRKSTQNEWKEFVVSDVLQDGNDDPARFLVKYFIPPLWIDCGQICGNQIVLTEEEDMEGC